MDMEPADMRACSVLQFVYLETSYKGISYLQLMGKKKFKQNFYKETPLAQGDRNKEVEGCRGKRTTLAFNRSVHHVFNNEHLDKSWIYEVGLCVLMWRNLRNKDDGEKQLAK